MKRKYPRVSDLQIKCKWIKRFIKMAALVADWSKSPGTKVGSVIVRPDKTVCSVGFNGFPRGIKDDKERYINQTFKHSCIIHAEVNAILSAKEPIKGYSIVTFPVMPCDRCAVMLIQAGIVRVVAPATKGTTTMGDEPYARARFYFKEAGVKVTELAHE